MFRLRAAALALFSAFAPVAYAAAASLPIPEPSSHVLAGSGAAGTTDGAASTSAFLEPDGVTAGPTGSVFVADGRSNSIRSISDGRTHTVAGDASGRSGFADGPAARALFARPVGIAAARDGSLFVADSLNRRIRVIRSGRVSTFAGTGAAGSADGAAATATFTMPKGIALDGDGNVYVADYGVGIRKIAPDGSVSTLSLPNNKNVFAVAARGSGTGLELAYTDGDGIHIVDGGQHRGLPFSRDREPYSEENTIGHAFGIAIVDADSVVVSDLWTDSVRYINFDDPPFRPAPKMRVLAGGKREGRLSETFVQGPQAAAEVDLRAPYGVAYTADGRILVADSGNRVVREIDALDPRLPIAAKSRGVKFAPNTYRIVIVGDSYAWNDVLWPESFAGVLERELRANGAAAGLAMPARVEVLSASAGTFASAKDFISTYLADGEADLVIFEYNRLALDHERQNEPALAGEAWKSQLPKRFAALAADLGAQKTRLAVALIPLPQSVSSDEGSVFRETDQTYDDETNYLSELDFEHSIASSGVHTIELLGDFRAAEARPGAAALYNVLDDHMTVLGSVLAGRSLASDLLGWKPWTAGR